MEKGSCKDGVIVQGADRGAENALAISEMQWSASSSRFTFMSHINCDVIWNN